MPNVTPTATPAAGGFLSVTFFYRPANSSAPRTKVLLTNTAGVWSTILTVAPGVYEHRFFIKSGPGQGYKTEVVGSTIPTAKSGIVPMSGRVDGVFQA